MGALCAFAIGIAKTGVPGVGILAVPLFVITVGDARLSAAWLLPILITADLYAVWIYRRDAAANQLFQLLPWVLGGFAVGAWFLRYPDTYVRPAVGMITVVMLCIYLYRRWNNLTATVMSKRWGGLFGVSAGFATVVANAAGPVMSIYLLSRNLPRQQFVATGAWFFFFVNVSKIPLYLYYGLFSRQSLQYDAVLIPVTLLGAFVGTRILQIIPEKVFTSAVAGLAFVAALLLLLPK